MSHPVPAPLAVKFTDASTGTLPLTYAWDFDNNGVTDSTLQNPTYTYSTAGTYTANLTVSNIAGSNSVSHIITVAAPVAPTALFTTNVTSGTAPLAVKFTDRPPVLLPCPIPGTLTITALRTALSRIRLTRIRLPGRIRQT